MIRGGIVGAILAVCVTEAIVIGIPGNQGPWAMLLGVVIGVVFGFAGVIIGDELTNDY